MLRINSNKKPRNRIKLWGSSILALGYNGKCIMVRSRFFNKKIQLNFL